MSNQILTINDQGNINTSNNGQIVHPILFPVTSSGNIKITNLPDPIMYISSSGNGSTSTTLPTTFNSRVLKNFTGSVQIYAPYYLLSLRTSLNTVGPTIGFSTPSQINASALNIASTLTALTRGNTGTENPNVLCIAAGLAVANTSYPASIQGVTYSSNTETSIFFNTTLASETNVNAVTLTSSSLYLDRYIGYSSSIAPVTSSTYPLIISGSTGSIATIPTSSFITSSILFNTSSIWLSQSLAANVSTTSATVYSNVFTLTGLTNGKTYIANLYLISRTAATTTGFRMRVVTGSTYLGSLFTPISTTAYAIQNSADANNITSAIAGTWPTINTNFLTYGEYSFIKTAAGDPQVQIISEVAGSSVTAGSGSVIFYRAIE